MYVIGVGGGDGGRMLLKERARSNKLISQTEIRLPRFEQRPR